MISKQEILNASILIVDDQSSHVILLEQMLESAGYFHVASTTDPYQVCSLYEQNDYDLIVLDTQMPCMDGFQIMEKLQTLGTGFHIPVLFITSEPSEKLKALTLGGKDFITKPFDLLDVQTRIHNMLEIQLLYKRLQNTNQMLEQKVIERTAELRVSEARFRRLTELSSDWYWEQNSDGEFVKTYGPVFEMLGIRLDGCSVSTEDEGVYWDEEERAILEANLVAQKPFLDFVYSRTKNDGTRQYLMVSGEPIFEPKVGFVGYRGIGKDVTEALFPQ
ncbi:hypothetical protein JCM14076_13110 [Methylosoma difficile]